jgi:integrase
VWIFHEGKQREWIVEGSKKEARAFEASKRVELVAERSVSNRASPTLTAFCRTVYEPHAERTLKESTWKKVRRYQVSTLREHLGGLKLTELEGDAIERFKRARHAAKIRPTSINNELRVLARILSHARSLKYPCTGEKLVKEKVRGAPRAKAWTSEEVARIFAAAREHVPEILPMLVFLANTGCRKGEAIVSEWSWIDDARGLLCIPSNEAWQPKNGLPREVALSAGVRLSLAGPKRSEQFLFPNRFGQRYAAFPEELFRRVIRAAKASGSPHRFRHTFASHFLAKVPDMFLLAKVLGHSHNRVTELYSHLLPGHLERAKDAVHLVPELTPARSHRTG